MTKIKEVAKSTLAPVVRAYFYAKASWPVWRASTSTARWLYRANRGVQDSVRERVAGDLVKNGIAVASLDELFPGQNLLPTLQSYESALELQAITKTNKLFLQQLWDVVPTLDLENPFIKLMLNRRVLDIVNDYVGSAAIYAYATLNVTLPVPEGAEAQQSQRWHRDPEDRKMCKVFIYLNDVDEGAGPFVYVPGSQRGGKYGTLFPQRPPRGVYPEAGEVEKKIPAEEMKPFTGKAGTVIFADTSGIHKGGCAQWSTYYVHGWFLHCGFCLARALCVPKQFFRAARFSARPDCPLRAHCDPGRPLSLRLRSIQKSL